MADADRWFVVKTGCPSLPLLTWSDCLAQWCGLGLKMGSHMVLADGPLVKWVYDLSEQWFGQGGSDTLNGATHLSDNIQYLVLLPRARVPMHMCTIVATHDKRYKKLGIICKCLSSLYGFPQFLLPNKHSVRFRARGGCGNNTCMNAKRNCVVQVCSKIKWDREHIKIIYATETSKSN